MIGIMKRNRQSKEHKNTAKKKIWIFVHEIFHIKKIYRVQQFNWLCATPIPTYKK